MPDLSGKHGLIVGVANKRSISWAIAQDASSAGARLALTYQGERLAENVTELAATVGALVRPCDVTDDRQISDVVSAIDHEFGGLDFLVNLIRNDLQTSKIFNPTIEQLGFRQRDGIAILPRLEFINGARVRQISPHRVLSPTIGERLDETRPPALAGMGDGLAHSFVDFGHVVAINTIARHGIGAGTICDPLD